MASRSLGTLTLDIVAKIGGYTAGLDKAEKEAAKRAKAIEDVFDKAAIGLGVAFGVMTTAAIGAFAAINRGIDLAAGFADLSEEIGASAEDIASFSVAAATAGVDIESFAAASIKLTKSLVGVDDESKAAGAALSNLGLNIADFKKLDPAAQYEAVGKALSGYADGAGKTAVAVALFGKAGAEQLKVFKALEEQGGRTKILTAEQIAQADQLRDAQAKLTAELGLYAAAISTQFIGPTNILLGLLKEAAKELLNTSGQVTALGVNTGVQQFAEGAGRELAKMIDYVTQSAKELKVLVDFVSTAGEIIGKAASFDLSGARKAGADFRERYGLDENGMAKAGQQAAKTFVEKYDAELTRARNDKNRALLNASNFGAATDNRPQLKPPVPTKPGGGSGAVDDPTKKLLDNDLKAFKAQADLAKDLLSDRNKILDLYNSQGLISVKDYYDALRGNAEEATAAQRKALDDQIKALQEFQAKTPKATDKADAQGKINELLSQQAKLERDSGNAAVEMGVKQQQAAVAYRDSLNEVNAKILELDGNLGKASEIRFDAQNRQLRALAEASGDVASVAQIDRLREYTKAQAELSAVQSKFSLAQGDLQIAEERITQARERGTTGEIEGLLASGKARQEAVAIMQAQLEKFQAIDAAARTPEQSQAIERLKLQLEGLKATIDPLGDKINQVFGDAAGSAFADFVTGTKTAKEALKDFSSSVIKTFADLAAKELGKQLLSSLLGSSSTGGAGGFGGLISSLIGASGGVGAAGGGDALGAFIALNGYASGGFTGVGAANDPAGIVHKGEYVLNAEQTRKIGVANLDKGNFGGSTVFNINVPQGINRNTGAQIAADAQRKLAQGSRNT